MINGWRREYQDNAFAEVVDGRGTEDVSSGFEGGIVVIEGDSPEREVSHAVGAEDGGEAGFGGVGGCGVFVGRRERKGEGEGGGEVLGQMGELELGDSLEDLGLSSLQLSQ